MSFKYDNLDVSTQQTLHIDTPKDWKVTMTVYVSMVFEHRFEVIKKLYPDTKPVTKYNGVPGHYEIKFSSFTTFSELIESIAQINAAIDLVADVEIKCLTKHQVPTDIILKKTIGRFPGITIFKIKNLEIGDLNLLNICIGDSLAQLSFTNCRIWNLIGNIKLLHRIRDFINFKKTKILEGEYHYGCGHVLKPGKALRSNSKYFQSENIKAIEDKFNPTKTSDDS